MLLRTHRNRKLEFVSAEKELRQPERVAGVVAHTIQE